ncbi:uncharacterized protein LOC143018013 [Oratosquilla oratoria]|uniref:uncharacterized protein LOC143018013 n=1 Tax=Oratosquilla oratoria TaxID=337810 RepID=UPI003F75C3FD
MFLQNCMKEQVLPKSVLPQRLVKMSDRPFDDFQRIILKKRIDIAKLEVKEAFRIKRISLHKFQCCVSSDVKNVLLDYCYGKMRMECEYLSRKLNMKLLALINDSDWTKHANPDFVVNLSSKPLTKVQSTALGFGLSFANNSNPSNIINIGKAFCNLKCDKDLPIYDVNICKGIVYGALANQVPPSCPERFITAINSLKKDSDLHITKADKSNAVVIMNKNDYLNKMDVLLKDQVTYVQLLKNPTESVNSHFNKKIKELLSGNSELIKKFISISPPLPYMYGLIKTHKPNNPVRPIVSSIGSASYKLSKWLVTILSPLVGTISTSHVKNSLDLINKLSEVKPDYEFKLVSYDIVSLFTKVPLDDLLIYLKEELNKHDLPLPSGTLIELIKLCVKDCKFQFNDKFYSQKFGMSMGNPLSPVLSNLYMEFFETKILSKIIPPNITWMRYIDDILCLWPIQDNVNDFLCKLNNLVSSIKFTVEIEKEGVLPFLDCNIYRRESELKFSVYRKPTNVCSYIHYYSSHPDGVKVSVFASMYLRALRICSPEYIDDEIGCIYDIGTKLQYPTHVLDKAYNRAKRTFYNLRSTQTFNMNNLLILPYQENLQNIPNMLRKFNINVVFNNKNTVRQLLINNSVNSNKGCVYKIPCKSCNQFYVGQTAKALTTRINQHKKYVREGNQSSGIFNHMNHFNHPVDWDNAKVITYNNNITERNLIECSLIKSSKGINVNLHQGLYKLDSFISHEISKLFEL